MANHYGGALRRFLSNFFFHNRGTNYRLTAKRFGILLLVIGIFFPAQILIWGGMFLDELLFPRYKKIRIREPIFIIGNPRSGTTFLHRLLARDTANFLTMRTWEIFISPSITMRRIIRRFVKIGQAIGVPIIKRIQRIENLWRESDKIHHLKLLLPEEDEYLFIHNLSTSKIWSFAAMEKDADPYIYFDEEIPLEDKGRIMDYYESCLQRHYFYHGRYKKHYLSKNPNFSPSIRTLLKKFPDAKFIYLIRDPLEAVPSHISLKNREWQMLGSPLEDFSCREFILKSSEHWYKYPLKVLRDLPSDQSFIMKFEDLVADAEGTVNDLYDQFHLSIGADFRRILEAETIKARNYRSKHSYSMAEMGINRAEMLDRFKDVMLEYDYLVET